MATLAVCAVTAAELCHRTDSQAPPPTTPDQQPQAEPGLIPLTVSEIGRLPADALHHPQPPDHALNWLTRRRRHQARARWHHQRTRLNRKYALVN